MTRISMHSILFGCGVVELYQAAVSYIVGDKAAMVFLSMAGLWTIGLVVKSTVWEHRRRTE